MKSGFKTPLPSQIGDDAELEWLLCLASTFQACQRTTGKDRMSVWRLVMRRLGVKPIARLLDIHVRCEKRRHDATTSGVRR
jgi:hypothetical protein